MLLKAIGNFAFRLVARIFRLDKLVVFVLSFLMTATTAMAEEKARVKEDLQQVAVKKEKVQAEPERNTHVVAAGTEASGSKAPEAPLAYTPTYGARFEIADAAHARKVLEVYKGWETNNLDGGLFAPSIEVQFPEGHSVKGREQVVALIRESRNGLASVKNTIGTVLSFRSPGKAESWVSVWARSEETDKAGRKANYSVNEIWRINKDGLIDFMRQYDSKHTG